MDVADSSCAFAGRDKWVDIGWVKLFVIFVLRAQAYPAHVLVATLGSHSVITLFNFSSLLTPQVFFGLVLR